MTIWPMRSRNGSDASVLSTQWRCAAVSGALGLNGGGGRYAGGAGSCTGFGDGGTEASR